MFGDTAKTGIKSVIIFVLKNNYHKLFILTLYVFNFLSLCYLNYLTWALKSINLNLFTGNNLRYSEFHRHLATSLNRYNKVRLVPSFGSYSPLDSTVSCVAALKRRA